MIAVLASRLDPEAQSLVAEWSSADAALLSAEDLSRAGWVFSPSAPQTGTAVVEGRRIPVSSLTGVLTRRPAVLAEELSALAPEDRAYVAAELNAFLVAWLAAIPCTVINRPTTTSLSGPSWDGIRWQAMCERLGIDWAETDEAAPSREVVVCSTKCFFAAGAREAAIAKALAHASGTELLGVRLAAGKVCGVTATPALTDVDVRVCLRKQLLSRP